MSMRMLSGTDETDAEVTWEDQSKINAFSRLFAQVSTLQEQYNAKKKDLATLDDLATELELVDEDDKLPYMVGEAYFSLTQPECLERIEASKSELGDELAGIKTRVDGINKELDQLKMALYKKFGKSINLDL